MWMHVVYSILYTFILYPYIIANCKTIDADPRQNFVSL